MCVEGRRAKQRTGCAPGRRFTCVGGKTLSVEDQASYAEWCRHALNDHLLVRLVHTAQPTPATFGGLILSLAYNALLYSLVCLLLQPLSGTNATHSQQQVMRLVLEARGWARLAVCPP